MQPSDDYQYHTSLGELLGQNLSAYEFFNGLPADIQKKLERADVSSFADLQAFADRQRYLR